MYQWNGSTTLRRTSINRCNNSKLRSSNMKLLKVPKSITKSYGDRRFSVADPKYWNLLSKDIRLSPSLDIFKSKLMFSSLKLTEHEPDHNLLIYLLGFRYVSSIFHARLCIVITMLNFLTFVRYNIVA